MTTIGLLVTLALSLLVAPLAAEAQSRATPARIAVLGLGAGPPASAPPTRGAGVPAAPASGEFSRPCWISTTHWI
jgi:hypothetical protein